MIPKIGTTTAAAAEQIAGNTDLLEEILVHLPPKSLTRSKLVSKQWLSQLSDAQFVHRHCQHSHTHRKFHTGMFVTDPDRICRSADFVSSTTEELNPTHQTIPSLGFLYDRIEPPVSEIEINSSCNGLVLCAVSWNSQPFDYCVCNPTTKTFRLLDINRNPVQCSPKATACLAFDSSAFAFLAFDPSASLHYKVICTSISKGFYLYSSEDQSWKTIACPYEFSPYQKGFFLNGSIYYRRFYGGRTPLCFDFYNEAVKQIVLPPMTKTFLDAFASHLYLLDRNTTPDFRVCEMSSDFSQRITKYNGSIGPLLSVFPQISYSFKGQVYYCFRGITMVEGAKQDESQLVIGIPGKLLLYNLKDKTAKELYNLRAPLDGPYGYAHVEAFQFIETLSVV